jgi:chemotaxis family two-component system sensor histidine kinase/response regulator PixL
MTGTILIVDDDQIVREGVGVLLERGGFGVAQASNGSEALTYLYCNPAPSLILLDMMMPRMDGWNFLEHYRMNAAWYAIPVIILTGMRIASAEWAESLGAVGLLKKPFDENELMNPVRDLC